MRTFAIVACVFQSLAWAHFSGKLSEKDSEMSFGCAILSLANVASVWAITT